MQMMMVKKEDTLKQYWPQIVKMLCNGASVNTGQLDTLQAEDDESGQDFVGDPETLAAALVHPGLWDATKHLIYLRLADELANSAAEEQHSASPTMNEPMRVPSR